MIDYTLYRVSFKEFSFSNLFRVTFNNTLCRGRREVRGKGCLGAANDGQVFHAFSFPLEILNFQFFSFCATLHVK
jgi:hypothetical protein